MDDDSTFFVANTTNNLMWDSSISFKPAANDMNDSAKTWCLFSFWRDILKSVWWDSDYSVWVFESELDSMREIDWTNHCDFWSSNDILAQEANICRLVGSAPLRCNVWHHYVIGMGGLYIYKQLSNSFCTFKC